MGYSPEVLNLRYIVESPMSFLGKVWAPRFSQDSSDNTIPFGTLFFSGLISTKDKNLDRETKAEYKVVVEARDAQGLRGESGTATVMIRLEDINDNFPIFTQCKPLPLSLKQTGWDNPDSTIWRVSQRYPKPLYISPYPGVLLEPEYGDLTPSLYIAPKVTQFHWWVPSQTRQKSHLCWCHCSASSSTVR